MQKILNYFSFLKTQNRLGTSYILIGENLLSFALELTKLINCPNDVYFCNVCKTCKQVEKKVSTDLYIFDGSDYIKIDQVKDFQRFLSLKCVFLKRKVLIINNAHNFLETAQSAFLKTLEEPPSNSIIFLLASRLDNFLPTIISRCRVIYLPFKGESIYDEHNFSFFKRMLTSSDFSFENREKAKIFFLYLITFLRDSMIFYITKEKKYLLNADNYEIISNLRIPFKDLVYKLEVALKLFDDLDNINLNLAKEILRNKVL